MQIVILVGFVIALMFQEVPSLGSWGSLIAPAIAVYLLGTAALSRTNTAFSLRSITRRGPTFPAAMKRHNLLVIGTQLWLLGGLAGLLLLGYRQWVIEGLNLRGLPLADEIVALAPFITAVLLVWVLDYPFDRAVRRNVCAPRSVSGEGGGEKGEKTARPVWTLREYLAYNTRHHLLFVAVPVGLILLAIDCLPWVVSRLLPEGPAEYVLLASVPLAGGTVFLFAPVLIVRIWKTHRLPGGALRDRLEEMCHTLGLKYRDILVWESGGMVANAGVMGLIARLRYILLSDGLLEGMDRRDIEVIFAHEAGHIINHHIFYAALFAVGSITVCVSLVEQLITLFTFPQWVGELLAMILLAVVWGFGFGLLSRRFERQSDVIAAWTAGDRADGEDPALITHEGAAVFARALRRVGQLNGISPAQRNWRHGSIAQRVGYVLRLGSMGGTRNSDDRGVRRIKRLLWVTGGVGAGLLGLQVVHQL